VLAALGGRREAEPAETGVPAGVHEHEADEDGGEQNLDDREDAEHGPQASSSAPHDPWYGARRVQADERIRKLIVLGDNRLAQGLPAKARESYAEALELAREAEIDGSLDALIELRLADLDARDSTG
jgi:hypothetical protein